MVLMVTNKFLVLICSIVQMDKHRWTWNDVDSVDFVEKLIDINSVIFGIYVSMESVKLVDFDW